MSPVLTTVFVTQKITLLYGAQGSNAGPLQVVNLDGSTTLYLSTQSNPVPNQPGTFPLGPLASLSFDGSQAIYGVTSGPAMIAGIVPGGNGFSPGELAISGPVTATISGPVTVNGNVGITGTPNVNIANTPAVTVSSGSVAVSSVSGTIDVSGSSVDITTGNVNATGVGGFILPGDVQSLYSSTTNTAIAPGTSFTPISGQDVTNYNSYDISLSVNDSSQSVLGHAHVYRLDLNWYDDLITGIPVFTETYWPWVGDSVNGLFAQGTGPMHGKYMTVTLTSPASAVGNITVNSALIFGSGRQTNLSDWRQHANAKIDHGYTSIGSNISLVTDNNLADTNGFANLAANGHYVIFLGMTSGPMDWSLLIGAGGSLTRGNLCALGSSNGQNQTSGNLNPQANLIEVLGTAAGTVTAGSQLMPRGGVAFIIDVGAAATTLQFTAVAQQGP